MNWRRMTDPFARSKTPVVNFANTANRLGVASMRFRLSPAEVKQLRKLEAQHGRNSEPCIQCLLDILFRSPR